MRFPSGARLGPYEVLGPLGAGGMGEVYRARDTRLGREVALKVVGDASSASDTHERFEREARTVSQLSHPNICTVHDVGREGEVHYFVMELLDGESLDRRLARGALPVAEALRIGAQIADGLAAAHARGIAHRDLKPGNVMLTRSGVKVLDFGLAKAIGPLAAGEASAALTVDAAHTASGVVVGTIPYMAPEQIEGKPAGTSADIFALGCVLYEMVTGRRPFAGASPAALLSAILTSEPPPIGARRRVPASLERVVRVCLAKDPAHRWQSAADVALQLRMVTDEDGAPASGGGPRHLWPAYAAAALGVAVAAFALLRPAARPAPATPVRFQMSPPPGHQFFRTVEHTSIAVSPDGARIAFVTSDSTGQRSIWVRPLAAAQATRVPGTEGAFSIMWSPDGRSIAFFADRALRRLTLPDGAPVTISEMAAGSGTAGSGTTGSWGAGNDILFSGVQGDAVFRVPAGGGTPAAVARADSSTGRLRWTWPVHLPDGDHFLCTVRGFDGADSILWVDRAGHARAVVAAGSNAQYVEPGWLLFVREGTLLAQRFDPRTGRVSGSVSAITDDVAFFLSTGRAEYSSSPSGTLVYSTATDTGHLLELDLVSGATRSRGGPGGYLDVAIAPDGARALFSRAESRIGTFDIWSLDLASGNESRVTTNRNSDFAPVWLPNGSEVVYAASLGRTPWLHHLDLHTGAKRLLNDAGFEVPGSVTPDGRTVLYEELRGASYGIWQLPLDGSGAPRAWLTSPYDAIQPRVSPDGRRLAYLSNESGRFEAYVSPYPGPGEKVRLSPAGAVDVRWNPATGELVYLEPSGDLMGVSIGGGSPPTSGEPHMLARPAPDDLWSAFDVAPDGRRAWIVCADRRTALRPLDVVVHWPETITR